jgi:S1-C subfamily serine protease
MTAPISHGSSGGPVLDENAEVIAVSVAVLESGQNLNFAVPAKYIRTLLGDW